VTNEKYHSFCAGRDLPTSANQGGRARHFGLCLVKGFLIELASEEPDAQRLEREERELREHIRAFRAGNRLSRDDVHGRGK
jgi:hypothetical protein